MGSHNSPAYIAKEFPSFETVNRVTQKVPRHQGRILVLEYKSKDNAPKEHLCFVGKGVTYDTGGADIKAGGNMKGMHRDKCGAANCLGLMYAVAKLQPKNINITVYACIVRNSIGADCYVADEVVQSRAGKYMRICNTDYEGRMAMVDLLCLGRERALAENWPEPKFFTVATLTGHAVIAFGAGYTAVMSNGLGQKQKIPQRLFDAGHAVGEPFEFDHIRREDMIASTCFDGYAEIRQSGFGASTATQRGHQQPAGFLLLASGLADHGLNSEKPMSYTHLEMAGAAGLYPNPPTGHPIKAILKAFCDY